MPSLLRAVLIIALTAYAALLLFVLTTTSSDVPSGLVDRATQIGLRLHAPESLVQRPRVEFGLNVLAFAPLSFLGSLLRPTMTVSAWVAWGFFASLVVEGAQAMMPERMATHSDVVANTLGAAVGAVLAWVAIRSFAGRG